MQLQEAVRSSSYMYYILFHGLVVNSVSSHSHQMSVASHFESHYTRPSLALCVQVSGAFQAHTLKKAGVHDYDTFVVKYSEYLPNAHVSVYLFNCTYQSCKLNEGDIDRLYGYIIKSLNMAANNSIPRRKSDLPCYLIPSSRVRLLVIPMTIFL